jgi:interleukin-1 receptor-associated kinase 1
LSYFSKAEIFFLSRLGFKLSNIFFFLLKILAVKIINMAGLSYREEEKFLDVICTASKLKHPNIIQLNGYCLERGEHLLVYDYFGNLTLNDALHGGACEPLSWVQRLQIALAVAQALE